MEESDDKYSLLEDKSKSRVRGSLVRKTDSLDVLVDKIAVSSRTRGYLKDNGECEYGVPYVRVHFDTGKTGISKRFVIDPFVSASYETRSSHEFFGSLLSTAGVMWDSLPDLIGCRVNISSDSGSGRFYLSNPSERRDFSVLLDTNVEMIEHPNIDDFFTDMVCKHVKNTTIGTAEIVRIKSRRRKAELFFELDSGDLFSHEFRLKKKKSRASRKGPYYGRLRRSTYMNTKKNNRDSYTFWDFVEDSLGYTPNQSEYEEIIGLNVPVEYVSGEWFPETAVEYI